MKKYLQKLKKQEEEPEEPILKLNNACPFCDGSVKGNKIIKFYCKHCNFLFNRRELKDFETKEEQNV